MCGPCRAGNQTVLEVRVHAHAHVPLILSLPLPQFGVLAEKAGSGSGAAMGPGGTFGYAELSIDGRPSCVQIGTHGSLTRAELQEIATGGPKGAILLPGRDEPAESRSSAQRRQRCWRATVPDGAAGVGSLDPGGLPCTVCKARLRSPRPFPVSVSSGVGRLARALRRSGAGAIRL